MKRAACFVAACLLLPGSAAFSNGDAAATAPHFVQARDGNSLTFTFTQLGARTEGHFRVFATDMVYDPANPAAGSLRVTVQVGSVDTQDAERDEVLVGPELLDAPNYPTATFVADSLAAVTNGLEAVGRLTIRGVTRPLRLPLTLRPGPAGLELTGQVTIRRLDFGIGQGDWRSTESIGDEVQVRYKVLLVKVT